ncbi:MAG: proline--tRNA ligase [Bacteroidetes bacterium]|nr:MAG: proline--tRNA ligase [Bacteroidota bacterium]REK06451.1 MAG: proline--tRNA ligase [Bacteroidota bacterium]REK33217.1 MAG: proline--tRNA ligase [Bacteroidota bacterium]REK47054.1 MAG: proline--tRNA ligase [Bacteroidota bacterium]
MAKDFPTRAENYAQWYQDLVIKADLAENSAVRGCMVIKPYGYAIWEKMQAVLDRKFKETGHSNAYFPLFIPKSFFSKEASHVEGFAKECAIVTHYRLKNAEDGNGVVVDPEAKLEEELIIRPTSETIIWNTYRGWIQSYRDLPILVNQWANVVRWEMRTRLFLRTAEFLWQEGHTAHATKEEAIEETKRMLDVYADFVENTMAVPVYKGVKTANERFAGALDTYCIEAMMQDGKALQAGTSHFLGQNFAKAFDVKFTGKDGKQDFVWATSWGVSTRLMGALVMAHSDDDGLVLPPKLAPIQVVIVPIHKNDEQLAAITVVANKIVDELKKLGISVKYDDRDTHKPGWKFSEYEFKGVPVRVAIGPRDLENGTVEVARRDTKEKSVMQLTDLTLKISHLLDHIQDNLYKKALTFREENTHHADSYDEFKKKIEQGGFVMAHWDGTTETELKIKEETKATIRCIPLNAKKEKGKCIFSGNDSEQRVIFAQAY